MKAVRPFACPAFLTLVVLTACASSRETAERGSQRAGGSAFTLAVDGTGFVARHPQLDLRARFADDGRVTLSSALGTSWSMTMRASTFGRTGTSRPLEKTVVHASHTRVTYDHGALREWYENGPRGVEQGFDVATRPPGDGELTIALETQGLKPVSMSDQLVVLRDATHEVVAIEDLTVKDARGRSVPARLVVEGASVSIRVDDRDAEYPLAIDPYYSSLEQKLVPSDSGGLFGTSVGLSGNTMVIGAPAADGKGAAYVFTKSGATWTQQQKIQPAGATAGSQFGVAVAIVNDTIVVGAMNPTTAEGSVSFFVRSASVWSQQQRISGYQRLGASVAIAEAADGTTAVVGQPYANDALIYRRAGVTWSKVGNVHFTPSGEFSREYGFSVAICGDHAIAGGPYGGNEHGNVAVARRGELGVLPPNNWGPHMTAGVLNPASTNGYEHMGWSVACDGMVVVGGGPGTSSAKGAVNTWILPSFNGTAVTGVGTTNGDEAGTSVAIAGGVIAYGTPKNDNAAGTDAGSVGLATKPGTTWAYDATILSGEAAAAGDLYGSALAMTVDMVVVGAPKNDAKGADAGAVYVHRYYPKRALGGACTRGGECTSDYCIDGVCCNVATCGGCQACSAAKKGSGADGTCGNIGDGLPPAGPGQCVAGTCVGNTGTVIGAHVCNGSGQCRVGATTMCAPFACNASPAACKTTCATDGDCVSTAHCDTGTSTCKTDLDAGTACTRGAQCASGFCADGVCCDKACTGKCEACSAAKKGFGSDGVCDAVTADTDPKDQCAPGGEACSAPGTCDGNGACRLFAKNATPCGATTCVDGKVTGKLCNGAGACADASGISCAAYACSAAACTTTCTEATAATDCAGTAFCTTSGTCAPKKASGTTCGSGKECASGFCVDGVCCASTCTGQCESCNEAGTEGACVPVRGTPRGKRPT